MLLPLLCSTMTRTLIHLVRHAEVENPDNIWYGRLEGFVLSERGRRQAAALGDHFASRTLDAVYSSPLPRALQTATAIARPQGLDLKEEPDIIESETRLQGRYGDSRLFLNPLRIRYFLNPFRPSWGESFGGISERMLRGIERMRANHLGGDVVAVSHMTPILVARLRVEGRRIPPWMSGLPCERGSITTLEFVDGRHAATTHLDAVSKVG